MTEKLDLFQLEQRFLAIEKRIKTLEDGNLAWKIKSLQQGETYAVEELGRIKDRVKMLEEGLVNQNFSSRIDTLERGVLKLFEKTGIERSLAIIRQATETLQDFPYENYSPIDLLIQNYWLLGVWIDKLAKVPYLNKHFKLSVMKSFHKDLDSFLRNYQTTKEIVNLEPTPIAQAKPNRFFRIYEDDLIRLYIEEHRFRFLTKHDSTAYDVPIAKLKEILCNNETHTKTILEDDKKTA